MALVAEFTLLQPAPPAGPLPDIALGRPGARPIAEVPVPNLEAPLDLKPRTVTHPLKVSPKTALAHAVLSVMLSGSPKEFTLGNNALAFP